MKLEFSEESTIYSYDNWLITKEKFVLNVAYAWKIEGSIYCYRFTVNPRIILVMYRFNGLAEKTFVLSEHEAVCYVTLKWCYAISCSSFSKTLKPVGLVIVRFYSGIKGLILCDLISVFFYGQILFSSVMQPEEVMMKFSN